jgi:hypothetical protein
MPPLVPVQIPPTAEVDCHLVEKINADGNCIVLDRNMAS